MPFDSDGRTQPANLPQYINTRIMPVAGGQFSVVMEATWLDEADFQFVAQDLTNAHVDSLDAALTLIAHELRNSALVAHRSSS
jgi:hypothetical protein